MDEGIAVKVDGMTKIIMAATSFAGHGEET
jgi:hypothetical protein